MEDLEKENAKKLQNLMKEMHESNTAPDNVLIVGKDIGFLAKFDSVFDCATALLAASKNNERLMDSVMLAAKAMEEVVDARKRREEAFLVSSEIGMA